MSSRGMQSSRASLQSSRAKRGICSSRTSTPDPSSLTRLGMTAVLSLLAFAGAHAQTPGDEPIVVTRHQVTIGDRTLAYTARAGRIAMRGADGSVHGQMFFVSYTLDHAPNARPRPLTFAWNGGPGSNAGLVHLIGFGPKRIAPPPGDTDASGRWTVIPNDGTWLDFTDLVFVDPIGTGYSRVTKPEYMHEFYSTRGDAESVARFIGLWRARYSSAGAPLFLAGESYGVTRAANVADILESQGTRVRGVILMGLEPPVGHISDTLRAALAVPSYTVAAFTHHKLAPELQHDLRATMEQAERWASVDYASMLQHVATLTDAQRDSVARTLARFTGLDASGIDRKTLVVPVMQFARTLLGKEGRFVGLYDVRRTAPLDTTPGPYDPRVDPSLMHLNDPVAILRYLRNELGYRTDLNYQGPWGGSYPPPASFRGDWMSVRWDWKADTAIKSLPLEAAMRADTSLLVQAICGLHDLICPWAVVGAKLASAPPELQERIEGARIAGGHAVYTDDHARMMLRAGARAFIENGGVVKVRP
jgi:carboxypeptidase C (cathepsin A)